MTNQIFILLNSVTIILLGIMIFIGFRYVNSQKQKELLNEQYKKNEAEKLTDFKKTVTDKLEGVTNSYNTFSNEITKNISSSFSKYEENAKNFHRSVEKMYQSQDDLTKIFSNVKKFGTAGELTLGSLLSDLLSPSQFVPNAHIKKDESKHVEFAIKMPKSGILVPIDSYFPAAVLERIRDADEEKDKEKSAKARNDLATEVNKKAEKIKEKYIFPPKTSAFGVVYFPTENLFYEVCSHRDKKTKEPLIQSLYRKHNIMALGPTTISIWLQCLHWNYENYQIGSRSRQIYEDLQSLRFGFSEHLKLLQSAWKDSKQSLDKIEKAGKSADSISTTLENVKEPETLDIAPEKNPNNLKVLK